MSAREKAVQELRDITGATPVDANRLLKRAAWRLEQLKLKSTSTPGARSLATTSRARAHQLVRPAMGMSFIIDANGLLELHYLMRGPGISFMHPDYIFYQVIEQQLTDQAIDLYYNDATAQANAAAANVDKDRQKKLGDIWEKYKDRDTKNPQLITIEGTMKLCEQLEIDPSSDSVLFCLATDLGSKAIGEWEKQPWIEGWSAMPGKIDSLAKMKSHLPAIRKQLKSDPAYFKKVYMHTFDLSKAPGARTLVLDTAIDYWNLFIPPALESRPSALSRMIDPDNDTTAVTDPEFTAEHLELWIDFHRKKARAISRDTWSLFIEFIRSIDSKFETFDEDGAWPSTIDDFVEYVREKQKTS